ncbi:hypothetical protein [Agrobacterium rubi]|uniref:hypothetical protein n=1 Tax=Agrobacterium rubi TaxID=28099 RepID=UPI000B065797|nr:hypothetical protein [Agrobacterium rubi]NTE87456.1 hypothetical protein [Agrobacterium rubi]NTF03310.1 hypothetical protein [Agrobacterium rubi]
MGLAPENDPFLQSVSQVFCGIPLPGDAAFAVIVEFYERSKPEVLASMPWVAAELCEHEGLETMLGFIEKNGGRRLYIAKDFKAFNKKISVVIKETTHERLRHFARDHSLIDIPSLWGIFLALRRVAIRHFIRKGANPGRISKDFGVTDRYIRKESKLINDGDVCN